MGESFFLRLLLLLGLLDPKFLLVVHSLLFDGLPLVGNFVQSKLVVIILSLVVVVRLT